MGSVDRIVGNFGKLRSQGLIHLIRLRLFQNLAFAKRFVALNRFNFPSSLQNRKSGMVRQPKHSFNKRAHVHVCYVLIYEQEIESI
jgi:hypothetical protein